MLPYRTLCRIGLTLLVLASTGPFAAAQRPSPIRPLAVDHPLTVDHPLAVDHIDETRLVTLPGNTRTAARLPQNDRGPVDDNLPLEHMLLLLQRPAGKEAELASLIDAMHNPASPQFHQWLTPAQFGARFGLASSDLSTITGWLAMHGFLVNHVFTNGAVIDFSGDAGHVREAFHTEIHYLQVHGEPHISNITDPQVPEALAPAIRGIVSLNDFRPQPLHRELTRAHIDPANGKLITTAVHPSAANAEYTEQPGSSTYRPIVPGDLATIYNLNPLFAAGYAGQGQTIAVIEDTNVYSPADWSTFRSTFGLARYSTASFTQVHPGNCADPGINLNDSEAILDAEYASASAPGAAIQLVSCADTQTTFGGLLALQNLINSPKTPPAIVSISYGACEAENGATGNASYTATYQQATAEGISVFVSSGDEGAAGCDPDAHAATHGSNVNGFASTAYNVAVGGTDFGDTYAGASTTYWNPTNSAAYASARSYINEIPWNDSCASALLSTAATASAIPWGSKGFCNSSLGTEYYLTTTSGSGGASSCFTGAASILGVTSGTCRGNPKPSWQTGVPGIPSDSVRDLPDVSLFAANGVWGHYYIYCDSDPANGGTPCKGAPSGWSGAGGTSFAAPLLAGIQALVNQKNGGRQGNPNAVYYKLAALQYTSRSAASCNSTRGHSAGTACTFYDITQGDSNVNCTGIHGCYRPSGINGVLSTSASSYKPAFTASAGYDLATGIGSINAYNLVNNWAAATRITIKLMARR